MKKALVSFLLLCGVSVVVPGISPASVTAIDIPEYTQLLPLCTNPYAATVPCHDPAGGTDETRVVMVQCTVVITNYCYDITVNGSPAPSTLKLVAWMMAYKTHDPTVAIAQFEASFSLYNVPVGNVLNTAETWGVGQIPKNQTGAGGKFDLTSVLAPTDVVKVIAKFKMHKMPQYNVLVASDALMSFALSGTDLTVTMEGKAAKVALETTAQHINFDTEKNDDPSVPWVNRCGIPSMQFVVCNVDKAESNPLLFYARSGTAVNSPAADTPGPIWVSTNATYYHQPGVSIDSRGNRRLLVRVAAPHFLADGTTLNSGSFRTFLPNGLLDLWKVEKTKEGIENSLATSVKKDGVETVLERTITVTETGVLITFPNLTFSSPEVYVTSVTGTSGKSANQVLASYLAGANTSAGTVSPVTGTVTTTVGATAKTVKKGSKTLLTSLIKPTAKSTTKWSVSGSGCKIVGTRLTVTTTAKSCSLTLKQTDSKTKKTTSKKVTVKVS